MNVTRQTVLVALAAVALLGGCKKPPAKPKGIGKALVSQSARSLALTADGKTLVFVGEVNPPPEKGAPEGVFQGVLTTVPLAGGVHRQLGGGVSTLEDGYRLSADGRFVAYLQGFRFRDQSGALHVAPSGDGEARPLASDAKFYRFSPDSKWLGYVASGEMHLYDLATSADRLVAREITTFEFSSDSRRLLLRRPVTSGGDLLLAEVEAGREPSKLGDQVGDYQFTPDGSGLAFTARVGGPSEPYSLFVGPVGGPYLRHGEGVTALFFSPDGKWLAFLDGLGSKDGSTHLSLVPVAGGPAKRVGDNVQECRWSPTSQHLALRESNDDKGRKWTALKVVAVPGTVAHTETWGPNKTIDRIPLQWSPDGSHLAYVHPVIKPEVSYNLYQVAAAGGESRLVAKWVYGFQYSPDGRELWYRTECSREGRACDLMAITTGDAGGPPRPVVSGIGGFRAAKSGSRLLIWYMRGDTDAAVDLGWLDLTAKQPSRGVDQYVLPGAILVDDAGSAVAYVVGERKREGVYVAELK